MSRIRVNTNVLEQQQAQMVKVMETLRSVSADVSYVNRNLSWNISSRPQIKSTLTKYSNYVDTLQMRTRKLSNELQSAAKQYKDVEKKVGAIAVGTFKNHDKDRTGKMVQKTDSPKEKDSLWTWSDTWKMLGQAGILGSGIALIGQLITGGVSTKNMLKVLKYGTGTIEKIAKSVSNPSFDWRTLFGLEGVIKKSTPKTYGLALKEQLDKLNFSNADTVSKKIAVGAKWAGHALTLAITAYDNFTDEDNTTFGRKIAETIGETTVKIGESILIGAGVTAALAAMGAVGAPAILVGGITVGITWGLDKISEAVFDKDVAELVSDTALDFGKNVINAGKDLGARAGATARKIGDKISSWWNKTPQLAGAW